MFNWFRKKAEPITDPALLTLQDYPPFKRPHLGDPTNFTKQQLQDNIDHLNEVHEERIEIILNFLKQFEFELGNLKPNEFFETIDKIGPLIKQNIIVKVINSNPRLFNEKLKARWPKSYEGDYIIFSFLQDFAILAFDYYNKHFSNKLYWGLQEDLNFDPAIEAEPDLTEYNTIVVRGLKCKDGDPQSFLDLEEGLLWSIEGIINNIPSWFILPSQDFEAISENYIPIESK